MDTETRAIRIIKASKLRWWCMRAWPRFCAACAQLYYPLARVCVSVFRVEREGRMITNHGARGAFGA